MTVQGCRSRRHDDDRRDGDRRGGGTRGGGGRDGRTDGGDRRGGGRQGVSQQSGLSGSPGAVGCDHRRAESRAAARRRWPGIAVYAPAHPPLRVRLALQRRRSEHLERPNAHLYANRRGGRMCAGIPVARLLIQRLASLITDRRRHAARPPGAPGGGLGTRRRLVRHALSTSGVTMLCTRMATRPQAHAIIVSNNSPRGSYGPFNHGLLASLP